jgi:uncharacterized protein (TIGR02421 family)
MLNFDRLEPLELEWEDIEQSYRIAKYNAPLNRKEERQKALDAYHRGQSYNPQLVYEPPPDYPVERIRRFMAKLEPDTSPLESLYYEKAYHELLAIEATQSHRPDHITASTCFMHGLPNTELLAEANRILEEVSPEMRSDAEYFSAEQTATRMQAVLERAGIQDWKAIAFEPMSAGISVNRLDKELKIRKGGRCSRSDLERLIVHEIGAHILRYENGAKQPVRLFQNAFPGTMATEEGVAVYSETRAGLLKARALRRYAGRVIAVNLALSRPFSDVFQKLAPILGNGEAFNIALRTKRGFADTAQPGAHVKDLVYLRGYLEVKAHLEQYPEDYPLLFAGKFGLQHLPLVKSLLEEQIISLPTFLPETLHENMV